MRFLWISWQPPMNCLLSSHSSSGRFLANIVTVLSKATAAVWFVAWWNFPRKQSYGKRKSEAEFPSTKARLSGFPIWLIKCFHMKIFSYIKRMAAVFICSGRHKHKLNRAGLHSSPCCHTSVSLSPPTDALWAIQHELLSSLPFLAISS